MEQLPESILLSMIMQLGDIFTTESRIHKLLNLRDLIILLVERQEQGEFVLTGSNRRHRRGRSMCDRHVLSRVVDEFMDFHLRLVWPSG